MAEKEKQHPLFRRRALEEQGKPRSLDTGLKVISGKAWLTLIGLIILVSTIIGWSFLGSIPIKVQGKGILISKQGGIFQASAPQGGGEVIELLVKPGDTVAIGQIVARLSAPHLQKEHEVANNYLQRLTKEKTKLSTLANKEINANAVVLDKQQKILESRLSLETENLNHVSTLLETKRKARASGIVTQDELMITLRDYYSSKREIESIKERLNQIVIDKKSFADRWNERSRQLSMDVERQRETVEQAQQKLNLAELVDSPINGIVNDVQASVGDQLAAGETVLTITQKDQELIALVFIPALDGKKIKPNMKAQITPTNIKKEEYGSMLGTVSSVSNFPTTPEALASLLHNKELEKYFSEAGAPIMTRVNLTPDAQTPSGYKWTSSKGPDETISAGTLVLADITTRTQSPISLIIPMLKKLFGG